MSLINLKRILEAYCAASGLLVNFHMSFIHFSSTNSEYVKLICCDSFGVDLINKPRNYLGVLAFVGKVEI